MLSGRFGNLRYEALVVIFLLLAVAFIWSKEGNRNDEARETTSQGSVTGRPKVPDRADDFVVSIDHENANSGAKIALSVEPKDLSQSKADEWKGLIERARAGDRVALEEAYRLMNPCIHLPVETGERDLFIDAISTSDGRTPEERARTVATFAQRFAACDRIPLEVQAAFDRELFALRAEKGTFEEKFQYMAQGFPRNANFDIGTPEMTQYRERSRRFLNEALESGDPKALSAMAWAYRRSHVFRPDPSRAYLYTYAYALVTGEVGPELLQRITLMEQQLIPATIPALREEAERVASCCKKTAALAGGAS